MSKLPDELIALSLMNLLPEDVLGKIGVSKKFKSAFENYDIPKKLVEKYFPYVDIEYEEDDYIDILKREIRRRKIILDSLYRNNKGFLISEAALLLLQEIRFHGEDDISDRPDMVLRRANPITEYDVYMAHRKYFESRSYTDSEDEDEDINEEHKEKFKERITDKFSKINGKKIRKIIKQGPESILPLLTRKTRYIYKGGELVSRYSHELWHQYYHDISSVRRSKMLRYIYNIISSDIRESLKNKFIETEDYDIIPVLNHYLPNK